MLQLTERIRRYMAALPPSVDGHQGDERLFKAADKLVNGFALEPGEALSFLREYNNRAEPPWPESRLIYKLNEALEHPLETRSRGYLLDAEKSYGTEPKEPAFYSQLKEDFANTRTNCQEPPLPAQDLPAHQSSSYQGQHISPSTQIVRELGIYYDHYRKDYWVNNDRGGWIMVGATDVKRRLAEKGFREKPLKNENISQIDSFLTTIQNSCDVDYAGSLAGYDRGIHEVGGHRILVKDSPELISPVPGSWPLLEGIIKRMLGLEGQTYLFGWLKVALESLYSRKFRPGQALALVGPKDCGKSLLQNHVITPLLGNRCAKPHRYMSGLTPFNSDLFAAEHLVIEDEQASTDIRARRNFGEKIKEVTANEHQSCHAKNRTAITLSPFWRLSITLNDEPENLLILPPMDDSVQDKLTILKAEKYPMPHPTVTNQEREAFIEALTAELPHFVHFLLNWPIPEHLQSHRYGIAHYQHPEILEALTSSTPETELLELINAELFSLSSASEWSGTASKLQQYLTRNDSDVRRQAERLLSWTGACGTYLGRLKKRFPARFEYQHTRTDRIWVVRPPE